MAFFIFGVGLGGVLTLFSQTAVVKKGAEELNKAIFLARQKMNEIKIKNSDTSEDGKFKAFPGYSFKYEIKTEEIDFSGVGQEGGDDEGSTSNSSTSSKARKYLEENNLISETVTGQTFPMRKYLVTISYGDGKTYKLEYYRAGNFR